MICPLCHLNKNKKIFVASNVHGRIKYGKQKIAFYKCLDCDCVFPNTKLSHNFYVDYYPKTYQQAPPAIDKLWIDFSLRTGHKYLPESGTLLDVGCGRGGFLNALPPNLIATGIDLNPQKITGKNIIKANFLTYKFSDKFDVITFWHSLEHFKNPQKSVNKALRLLNTHGKLIISIPNTNSLAFKVGQKDWFHLDSPRHLFLPNNVNIKQLFPKKYKISINYSPYEFPLDLFWSLKNKPYYWVIYPLLKIFDRETMVVSVVKP